MASGLWPVAFRPTDEMATKVFMEALSPTMEEGRLVKWMKAEGDAVKSGDVLAEVETDKAIMELVARGDGVLRKRLLDEGGTSAVGTLIAVIAAKDEDISSLIAGAGAAAAPAAPASAPAGPPPPPPPPPRRLLPRPAMGVIASPHSLTFQRNPQQLPHLPPLQHPLHPLHRLHPLPPADDSVLHHSRGDSQRNAASISTR